MNEGSIMNTTMNRRTAFRLDGYRYLMCSDKNIFFGQPLRVKIQFKMRRRLYETEGIFQLNTGIRKIKGLQGIKRLIPHRRLPLDLHAFRLLRLVRLLFRPLITDSDEELPLPTIDGLYTGNVECSED